MASATNSPFLAVCAQGKFVRIFFNGAGAIAGANIDWYLLEKSRVTSRSPAERNFHVFFQLLRGAERDLLGKRFPPALVVRIITYLRLVASRPAPA